MCQPAASGSARSRAFAPATNFATSVSDRCAANASRHGASASNVDRDRSANRASAAQSVRAAGPSTGCGDGWTFAASFSSSAASCCGVSALSATTSTEPSQSRSVFAGVYSSRTAWKLLPPNPNADIAARRGCPARGSHGRITVFT